jgi:hypothetical protein
MNSRELKLCKIKTAKMRIMAVFFQLVCFEILTKKRVKNKLLRFFYSAESIRLILTYLACIDSSELNILFFTCSQPNKQPLRPYFIPSKNALQGLSLFPISYFSPLKSLDTNTPAPLQLPLLNHTFFLKMPQLQPKACNLFHAYFPYQF